MSVRQELFTLTRDELKRVTVMELEQLSLEQRLRLREAV